MRPLTSLLLSLLLGLAASASGFPEFQSPLGSRLDHSAASQPEPVAMVSAQGPSDYDIWQRVQNHIRNQLGPLAGIERLDVRNPEQLRGIPTHIQGQLETRGTSRLMLADQHGNTAEARVQIYQQVLVYEPVRDIERGELLQRSDFRQRRIDQARARRSLDIREFGFEKPVMAARHLRAGQVLRTGDIERKPSIHRGDRISLLYDRNAILISMDGIALEDAFAGDQIRVRNTSSGQTVEARATSSGNARIY